MSLKISVVVPVYNNDRFLLKCVKSILDQTYRNIEVLLIDDGSTDTSYQLCDTLAAEDDRVRVVHTENRGVAAARNRGIDISTGDYITFVDSDDWIEPDMYGSMMDIVLQYNCDVVLCDCVKEFADHSVIYTHDIRPGYYDESQLKTEYYPHLLMMENVEYPATISNWLILYRIRQSETLYPTGLVRYVEGIRYSEDLLFGAELMLQAESFFYMKGSCFYHYRMNPDSASHKGAADKWNDYIRLYKEARNIIRSEEYSFEEQLNKMLLFFLYNAAGEMLENPSVRPIEKNKALRTILNNTEVCQMFSSLRIKDLPIPIKMKVMTALYKYKGIYLYTYLRRRNHG